MKARSVRGIMGLIKEFMEALADFKRANAALLATTQDPEVKKNFTTEYCTKVSLTNDQLYLLYERFLDCVKRLLL